MSVDKNTIKKLIQAAKINDFLVLSLPAVEQKQLQLAKQQLEKFMKISSEYLLVAIRL